MAPNSHSRAEWSWYSGPGLFAPRLGPAPPSLMWASRALTPRTSRTWPQDPGLSPTWAQVQGAQWAGCPAHGPPSQGGRDSGPRWSPGVGGSRTLLWPFTWGLPARAHPQDTQNAPLCIWRGHWGAWCPLGFPSTLEFWEGQALSLPEYGCPLFLSDPPGLGESRSQTPLLNFPADLHPSSHHLLAPTASTGLAGWGKSKPWPSSVPVEPSICLDSPALHLSRDRDYRPPRLGGGAVIVCRTAP